MAAACNQAQAPVIGIMNRTILGNFRFINSPSFRLFRAAHSSFSTLKRVDASDFANSNAVLKFNQLSSLYQKQPKLQMEKSALGSFEEIDGMSIELLQNLRSQGISKPTEIQGIFLSNYSSPEKFDLLIKSRPGTGKSIGYLMALLNDCLVRASIQKPVMDALPTPKHIILVPSELLANQLKNWIEVLIGNLNQRTKPSVSLLLTTDSSVEADCDILIGLPEKVHTHLAKGLLSLRALKSVVLDEVDALVKPLSRYAPLKDQKRRQKHPVPIMLFLAEVANLVKEKHLLSRPRLIAASATMNSRVRDELISCGICGKSALFLEEKYSSSPSSKPFLAKEPNNSSVAVKHFHSLLKDPEDVGELCGALRRIVEQRHSGRGVIFLPAEQSKAGLKNLLKSLPEFNHMNVELLTEYRSNHNTTSRLELLIGSDIDCRGIDIPDLSFVVIMDLPKSKEHYIHMSGRVGRTGQIASETSPSVYTILGTNEDFTRFNSILRQLSVSSLPFDF